MKRAKWIAAAGLALMVLLAGCRWGNVSLTVVQTSDIHHHASGYGPFLDYTPLDTTDGDCVTGGYARLATLIKDIREEGAARRTPTLLVDSGDFTMGTVYDMSASNPVSLRFFEHMGYDAVTLGNHEFDWSDSGLAMLLANGAANGFGVPVVASNTVIPADSPLSPIRDAGVIVDRKIVEYPCGLKVGILGLMGEDADAKAPVTGTATFDHDYAFIQSLVDDLRDREGVRLVIVLSHGGVNADGTGDDANLAANVTGIDVIASGHYHTATAEAFVSGGSGTIIFSPGEYGEYLSRLDLTYNVLLRRVVDWEFTLMPVDDTVPGDPEVQALVEEAHTLIDAGLQASGLAMSSPVSRTCFTLETEPFSESGLGSLAADSVRYQAGSVACLNDGNPCDFSVVASGVIRDSLSPGAWGLVTFADVYNVLPLGISPDSSQALPGYPLMSVYVTAGEIRNICEAALTVAPLLGSDYYLNLSGVRATYDPAYAPGLQGVREVALHAPDDYSCTGEPRILDLSDTAGLYHCVVDLYALNMMGAVTGMGLSIIPKDALGNVVYPDSYLARRIDSSPEPGVQELKEWMALLGFLADKFPADGPGIPEDLYGADGDALGRVRVVN